MMLCSFGYGSPPQTVKRVHFMDDLDDSGVVNQATSASSAFKCAWGNKSEEFHDRQGLDGEG